jgi:hypothetical protein
MFNVFKKDQIDKEEQDKSIQEIREKKLKDKRKSNLLFNQKFYRI